MSFEYNLPSELNKIKFAREAASVMRTHASQGLSNHVVGGHTFNMITMLLILKPDASGDLIRAVVQHDIPERITGDMPHPAKKAGIQDDAKQQEIESYLNILVFGHDAILSLSEEDTAWVHGLDMLEFYMYCRDEQMLGNRGITTKIMAVESYMEKYKHKYPEKILDVFYDLTDGSWETLPDAGGL